MKIKNHQKITYSLLKLKFFFFTRYNCISKIFPKIDLKFYFNITIHNQIFEFI